MAAHVTAYATVAEPADCQCSRQPARRPAPKVKRACSSVHTRVEATVITAFARPQGIRAASSATAKLERTPIPPPHSTNRANETSGPGAAGVRVASSMAVSIRFVRRSAGPQCLFA